MVKEMKAFHAFFRRSEVERLGIDVDGMTSPWGVVCLGLGEGNVYVLPVQETTRVVYRDGHLYDDLCSDPAFVRKTVHSC